MIDIDLTISDEEDDDDIVVIKSKIIDFNQFNNKPRSSQIDKEIYEFFYGTEDKTEEYLSIQHRSMRKEIVRNNYTIFCRKCNEYFNNISFIDHVINHYNININCLDNLLLPKSYENNNNNQQWCVIKCEICDLKFTSFITLGQHLQKKHVYKDMPYVCFICNFYKTSFLNELKQHFYNFHKFSQFLICPFCCEVIELHLKDENIDNILDSSLFIAHFDKHINNKRQFSCDKCCLKYFNKSDLIYHCNIYHNGRDIPDNINNNKNCFIGNDLLLNHNLYKNIIIKKSLNVTNQQIDITKLTINTPKLNLTCSECHENLINLLSHYQSFVMCLQCGFSSYCSSSFRKHTKTMHSFQINNDIITPNNNTTIDIYKDGFMLCQCGYQSLHGDKVAQHLTKCIYNYCTLKSRSCTNLLSQINNNINNNASLRSEDGLFLLPNVNNSSDSNDFYKILQLEKIS